MQDSTTTTDEDVRPEPVDEAEVLRRRKLTREKMRRYRKRILSRADSLKGLIEQLEADLGRRKACQRQQSMSSWMLSWQNVAQALHDDCLLAKKTQGILAVQFQRQRDLLISMRAWVDKLCYTSPSTTPATSSCWRSITLLGDPSSRKSGMDWITQNLFANTDHMLAACGFPSTLSPEVIDDFIVDATDYAHLRYCWRDQRRIPAPLEVVKRVLSSAFFRTQATSDFLDAHDLPAVAAISLSDAALLAEFDGAVKYSHHTDHRQRMYHLLSRDFHHPNRYVFLLQSFHADDCVDMPPQHSWRNQTDWFVLDRLPNGHTTLRMLTVMSHTLTSDGYVSMLDEATQWGVDLTGVPEVDHVRRLARGAYNRGVKYLGMVNTALVAALRSIVRP